MKNCSRKCCGSDCGSHHEEQAQGGGRILAEGGASKAQGCAGRENGTLVCLSESTLQRWEGAFRGPQAAEVTESQQVGLTLMTNVYGRVRAAGRGEKVAGAG